MDGLLILTSCITYDRLLITETWFILRARGLDVRCMAGLIRVAGLSSMILGICVPLVVVLLCLASWIGDRSRILLTSSCTRAFGQIMGSA